MQEINVKFTALFPYLPGQGRSMLFQMTYVLSMIEILLSMIKIE